MIAETIYDVNDTTFRRIVHVTVYEKQRVAKEGWVAFARSKVPVIRISGQWHVALVREVSDVTLKAIDS